MTTYASFSNRIELDDFPFYLFAPGLPASPTSGSQVAGASRPAAPVVVPAATGDRGPAR